MLQRVRKKTGRYVNLVHCLDRGASGCLLLLFTLEMRAGKEGNLTKDKDTTGGGCDVTRSLVEAIQDANKTYIAFCDGHGSWNGVKYLDSLYQSC